MQEKKESGALRKLKKLCGPSQGTLSVVPDGVYKNH